MEYRKKLEQIEVRFEELSQQLADPDITSDGDRYRKTAKARSDLEEVVSRYREWKRIDNDLEQARSMLTETDLDLLAMANDEIKRLEPERKQIEDELKILMLPKDPHDDKNVVLEIRAGTGGDEATLFAAEIFRMYNRFAESQHWRVEVTSVSESSVGGLKEVIALVNGEKVYSKMKYESGVHRVQRVPATEQQGRVHTSAITVAVLPEVDEVEVKLEPKDIRVDTFCSSGPGGQSVNTTYSAIRITHLPTGVVVSCQDEKSQIKNRAKAERVLRSRLYEIELEKQQAALGAERRSMVGTGDRSEKIRTYNFPQNRVSDHRIGLTLHQLDIVMEGHLDPIIDALTQHYQSEKMKGYGDQGAAASLKRSWRVTVQSALLQGAKLLEADGVAAPRLTAEVLLSFAVRRERSYLYGHPEHELSEVEWLHYGRYLHQRLNGTPTQYITKLQEFYGRPFRVTPDVLIPRPETEHVVARALELGKGARRFLDVGCGSGAIAITLQLGTGAEVWGTDISFAALTIADENAARLGARVFLAACDLDAGIASRSVDVLVSNPPYIPSGEISGLAREVRDHEPHVALTSGPTGFEIYERLIAGARRVLRPGGHLVMELGYNSSDRVLALLDGSFADIQLTADLAGIPRVVSCRLPS